jgi:hypothetical protein
MPQFNCDTLTLRLGGRSLNMKKVMIATPAYDGKVHAHYATSLVDTVMGLVQNGYQPNIQLAVGGSLLVHDRNRILMKFMQSDCEFLLCLDSDLGWNPHAVVRLLEIGKEMSGGCYPARDGKGFHFRPILNEDKSIAIEKETGLLKMENIPAGFMLLRRSAVEKMQQHFAHTYYKPKSDLMAHDDGYMLFALEVHDGEFWGEDYVFCRRAIQAGLDIWVDPTIEFNHAGVQGRLIDVLTTNPEEAAK